MFARQVDPLAEYSSAISAAEQQHRVQQEGVDQDSNLFTVRSSSHTIGPSNSTCSSSGSNKRKHPFQFEPEFFAALDSSLEHSEETDSSQTASLPQRVGSPWSARPVKRVKKSTLTPTFASSPSSLHDLTSPKVSPKSSPPQIPISAPQKTPSTTETTAAAPSFTHHGHNVPSSPSLTSRKRPPSCFSSSPPPSSHSNTLPKAPAFPQSSGPSIIDLSSGEELVTLRLGDNEHKRRSESDLSPPTGSPESLQEVFECMDDGTLQPIHDHTPAHLSPAKKVRLSKINHPVLRFLKDDEVDGPDKDFKKTQNRRTEGIGLHRPTHSGYWSGAAARRKGSAFVRNSRSSLTRRFWDDIGMESTRVGDYDLESSDVDQTREVSDCHLGSKDYQSEDHDPKQNKTTTNTTTGNIIPSKAGLQALIRYQEPRVIFSDDLERYDRKCWRDLKSTHIIPLEEAKGKELVLYRKMPFAIYSTHHFNTGGEEDPQKDAEEGGEEEGEEEDEEGEEDNPYLYAARNGHSSTVLIEELDDEDDGNMADDEECELSDDSPLVELEERIMDMDLD